MGMAELRTHSEKRGGKEEGKRNILRLLVGVLYMSGEVEIAANRDFYYAEYIQISHSQLSFS
jgi:hypothetical protein